MTCIGIQERTKAHGPVTAQQSMMSKSLEASQRDHVKQGSSMNRYAWGVVKKTTCQCQAWNVEEVVGSERHNYITLSTVAGLNISAPRDPELAAIFERGELESIGFNRRAPTPTYLQRTRLRVWQRRPTGSNFTPC
jgi:hypothetical protein